MFTKIGRCAVASYAPNTGPGASVLRNPVWVHVVVGDSSQPSVKYEPPAPRPPPRTNESRSGSATHPAPERGVGGPLMSSFVHDVPSHFHRSFSSAPLAASVR